MLNCPCRIEFEYRRSPLHSDASFHPCGRTEGEETHDAAYLKHVVFELNLAMPDILWLADQAGFNHWGPR